MAKAQHNSQLHHHDMHNALGEREMRPRLLHAHAGFRQRLVQHGKGEAGHPPLRRAARKAGTVASPSPLHRHSVHMAMPARNVHSRTPCAPSCPFMAPSARREGANALLVVVALARGSLHAWPFMCLLSLPQPRLYTSSIKSPWTWLSPHTPHPHSLPRSPRSPTSPTFPTSPSLHSHLHSPCQRRTRAPV